jgi:hypothetical protein
VSRFDPVPWIAASLLLLAGGLFLFWLSDEGADPVHASQGDEPTAPDAPSGPATAPSRPRRAESRGWVPADAREAVTPAEAPRNQPAQSASCDPRASLVDVAKNAAAAFEAELRESTAMSDSDESEIGERLEREAPRANVFAGKWDLPADRARYAPYLQALVDALSRGVRRQGLRYRIHLVRDEAFNAFAMAGGVLAVTTGVLEGPNAVSDEAELAAVLGHELAHVERRHPVAAYQYVRAILGESVDEAVIIGRLFTIPISTEHEHESDARGIELAALAGYDPFAASRLWARHVRSDGPSARSDGLAGALGDLVGMAEEVLHSHPPSRQRCGRARDVAARINDKATVDRWYRGASNLRDRVPGPQAPR